MSDIFKYTDDLQKQYPNIPKEELQTLNGYPIETAMEVIGLLSDDTENRGEYCQEKEDKNIDGEENNLSLDDILALNDIEEIKEFLEEKYRIKIYFGEKIKDSDSNYNGYISIFKGNDLVGEIRVDLFNLGHENYVDSHLGIEVYGEYQGKGFGKLLYKLYKRWSELDKNIFFPPEEYATKNSRMKMLLNMGYELDSVYNVSSADFRKLTEEEKRKILESKAENYYDRQNEIYKFILED